jgi:hypothetical protein
MWLDVVFWPSLKSVLVLLGNYNHGIGVDALIYGENYDGENLETLTPLTKQRFELIIKRIKEKDEYATI